MEFKSKISELSFSSISPPSDEIGKEIQWMLDHKTKPLGSLGRLESLALQMGKIQNSLKPKIEFPKLLLFAGDHGIAKEGVSAYPQEVTYQMVLNFLQGGAAANVLSRLAEIDLEIIDAGVNFEFKEHAVLSLRKVGKGTQSFLVEPAMSELELAECFHQGKKISQAAKDKGTNLLAFGEMGIGNTSSSSVLTHYLTQISLEKMVGSGTGLHKMGVKQKLGILQKSCLRFEKQFKNPSLVDLFRNFGGFEIMMMTGSILEGASLGMTLLIDGFISTAAFLCAYCIDPAVLDYAIFSHVSEEKGHKVQLEFLKVKAILNLNLRLGEGTGTLLALPILKASLCILEEMASFDSAGVSKKRI